MRFLNFSCSSLTVDEHQKYDENANKLEGGLLEKYEITVQIDRIWILGGLFSDTTEQISV